MKSSKVALTLLCGAILAFTLSGCETAQDVLNTTAKNIGKGLGHFQEDE